MRGIVRKSYEKYREPPLLLKIIVRNRDINF
nr:MAG TPA: hypothetical protein [Caudoviricetes sp.]